MFDDRPSTSSERLGLELLLFVCQHPNAARGQEVPLSEFNPYSKPQGPRDVIVAVGLLQSNGYARADGETLGAPDGVMLTDSGRQAAHQLLARREQARERNMSARDALLAWAYDVQHEHWPHVSRFVESSGNYFLGEPFGPSDLESACRWLADEGFIMLPGNSPKAAFRIQITSKGMQRFESGRSPNLEAPFVTTQNNTHFHGNVSSSAIAVGSVNVTQAITVSAAAREEAQDIAEMILDLYTRLGLDPEEEARLKESAEKIENEEDPGRLKRWYTRALVLLEKAPNAVAAAVRLKQLISGVIDSFGPAPS